MKLKARRLKLKLRKLKSEGIIFFKICVLLELVAFYGVKLLIFETFVA